MSGGKIPLINYSSKVFICFITYFFSLRIVFICTSFCLTVDISLKIKFKMFYCVQMYAAATDFLFLNLSYVKGPTSSTSCVLSKNLLRIFLKLSVFEKIYENLHFLLFSCCWAEPEVICLKTLLLEFCKDEMNRALLTSSLKFLRTCFMIKLHWIFKLGRNIKFTFS